MEEPRLSVRRGRGSASGDHNIKLKQLPPGIPGIPPERKPSMCKLIRAVPWDGCVRSQRYIARSGDAAFGQLLQSAPAPPVCKSILPEIVEKWPLRVERMDLLACAELPYFHRERGMSCEVKVAHGAQQLVRALQFYARNSKSIGRVIYTFRNGKGKAKAVKKSSRLLGARRVIHRKRNSHWSAGLSSKSHEGS